MKKLILKISEYKLVFISVTFLVIFSVGCAKKDEKEIKIGAILPLTGDLADPGSKSINAIKLVALLQSEWVKIMDFKSPLACRLRSLTVDILHLLIHKPFAELPVLYC